MHDDDQAVPGPHYWDMEPHPMQAHADKQFKWFDQVTQEPSPTHLLASVSLRSVESSQPATAWGGLAPYRC